MSFQRLYEAACEEPSDIWEHLPFFREVGSKSSKIIELGTRGGRSTVAFLYGLEGRGHLWSVDISPPPTNETHDGWTFIQGNDLDPEVFKQLPDDVDAVFIDTSHEYKQTAAELNLYRWKVRAGGKILLHDTEVAKPFGLWKQPPYPVKRAVEEFCAENGFGWDNRPNNHGLGIIYL